MDHVPASAEARLDAASRIRKHQIGAVRRRWDAVCTEAGLSATARRYFWRRHSLNPFAFAGVPASLEA